METQENHFAEGDLQKVYQAILEACEDIAAHLRYNTSNKITTANDFGDTQLDMDVQTDSLIFESLRNSGVVSQGFSEERAYVTQLCDGGKYIVCFDPLDGSSIVDTNFTIGSIFAIFPHGDLKTMTGRDMVGAALALYGSRTNCLIYNTVKNQVDEVTLQKITDDKSAWVHSRSNIRIRPEGKYFSPGNTRSIKENKGYRDCIQFWSSNGYHLRYSGGMAPDCYHIFVKGEGIFSSVSSLPKIQPKLRLLYECLPIAFLIEKAGGLSSNGEINLLDVKIESYTQKVDIIVGSGEEVARVDRFLEAGRKK